MLDLFTIALFTIAPFAAVSALTLGVSRSSAPDGHTWTLRGRSWSFAPAGWGWNAA
jgi:hypothetical protein